MNLGEATAIFKNIYNSERTPEEKKQAIKIVVGIETHNSITKQEILNALDWLCLQEDCYGGWIPCNERLPQKSGRYLVYIKSEKYGNSVEICLYNYLLKDWFYLAETLKECPDTYKKISDSVIAWQPLPTIYNGFGEIGK